MKALGLVVLEKIFYVFHCKSMGANNPRDGAILTYTNTPPPEFNSRSLLKGLW